MIKAILFDFDGTIVDSDRVTLMEFVNLMQHYKYPIPSSEQLLKLRGIPAIDIIKKLLSDIPDKKIQEMYDFKNKNAARFMPNIKLFPNVKKVLIKLSKNYKLAVVTSRRRRGLDMLLKQHHLENFFSATIAKEDVANHKPHPEGILKTIKMLKVKRDEVVYIGDAETDVTVTNNAGIPCILISQDKEDYGTRYHLSGMVELPELINKINI